MADTAVHRYPRGRRPGFFDDPAMDEAMSMIMVLASEVSTLRDRLDTMQRVAAERGLFDAAALEAYVPDEAVLAERESMRQEMLERLFFVATKRARELESRDDDSRYRQVIDETAGS